VKKHLFFLFIFWLQFGFSQINKHIIDVNTNQKIESSIYYCPQDIFDLKINSDAVSSDDYTIIKTTTPIAKGTTDFVFNRDDANGFSKSIDLGFNFNFYGQTYTKVVVGRNGRLVFSNSPELDQLWDDSIYIDQTFSGVNATPKFDLPSPAYNRVYKNDPTKELPMAQIFGGYTDIIFNPSYKNRTYYKYTKNYQYNGVSGLLISMEGLVHWNRTGTISSTQYDSFIILLSNGQIITKVNGKTETGYNAILGMQDEAGRLFKVPAHSTSGSSYNNGAWRSEAVTFEFSPNLKRVEAIKWYSNADLLYTGPTYQFKPTKDPQELLKVVISYDGGSEDSSEVMFSRIPTAQISAPVYDISACARPARMEVLNPNAELQYDWFSIADPTHPVATNQTFYLAGNGTYYVRVKNKKGSYCGESNHETVTLTSSVPVFLHSNQTIKKCDALGSSSERFDLLDYYPADPTKYDLEFTDGTRVYNAATGYLITLNSGELKNIKIKVVGKGVSAGCTLDDDFKLTYLSLPLNGKNYVSEQLCVGETKYTTAQFKARFFSGTDYRIVFSTDGIQFNINEVFPVKGQKVYVKISSPEFACESVGTLDFDFYPEVIANAPVTQLPDQCASATQTFDLASLIPEINPSPQVRVSFHESLADAQSGSREVALHYRSGIDEHTLYIRVIDQVTGCASQDHPTILLRVYRKPNIKVPQPIVKTNCEGSTIFDLTQNIDALTDAAAPIVVVANYYAENGTKLSPFEIQNYDTSVFGTKPYIKLEYNTTCGDRVSFDLRFNPKPRAIKTQDFVCGETSYSLDALKLNMVADPSKYRFTDEVGNQLPAQLTWASLPYTVKVRITEISTGCVSDTIDFTIVQGTPTPLKTGSFQAPAKCDVDFDGKTDFNLNDYKADFTSDASAVFTYYSDPARTQQIQPQFINAQAFRQVVYLKISSAGHCPINAEIILTVHTPTKSSTLIDKYFICYGETAVLYAGTENENFQWSDGEMGASSAVRLFKKAGTYTVKLTNANGCSYVHSFVISDEKQARIFKITQDDEKIFVEATGGVQPYQYSFDGGITWQNSPTLLRPTHDKYTIQVRSVLSEGGYCLGEKKSIYTLSFVNVITPNGDGKNDTWEVKNLDKMQDVDLRIIDRNGRSVFETKDTSRLIWDGKSNGRPLSTGTYWYMVRWTDPASLQTEERKGWILLKNN